MTRSEHHRGADVGMHRMIALLLALVLVLTACGGGGESADEGSGDPEEVAAPEERDEGEPQPGGEITVGLESETNSWLPGTYAGTQAGYNVAYAIFDPLLARGEDGDLHPYLAETFEANEDLTEYTLKLREGIEFHDGTPLNAEALKSNFAVLTAEGANTAANLEGVEMEVVDDLTVKYIMPEPNAGFPDLLQLPTGWPFSPTAYEEMGEDFGDNPVGTGPFTFGSWTRDDKLVVEKNEDYWQEGLPYLDRVTFRPIPDEDSRAAALSAGDIQATQSVRLSEFLARVREMEGVRVHMGAGNAGSGAIFNTNQPPVDDPRVRRSLAYALDQEGLIEVIAGEAASVTEQRTQYFSEDSPYYSEQVAEEWPTNNPEEAQRLHDEYVNDPDRSDGKAVGEPIEIEFDCTAVASLQEQAQAYQGMWEAVGFDVQLNAVEQSVHIQNALNDEYMVNCWRMGGDEDPYIILSTAFGDPDEQLQNFTNYHNEEVQEVLDTLRTNADVETRAQAIEDLGLLFAEDVPNTWTGGNNEFIGAVDEIYGIGSFTMPDGEPGTKQNRGIGRWSHVWLGE